MEEIKRDDDTRYFKLREMSIKINSKPLGINGVNINRRIILCHCLRRNIIFFINSFTGNTMIFNDLGYFKQTEKNKHKLSEFLDKNFVKLDGFEPCIKN